SGRLLGGSPCNANYSVALKQAPPARRHLPDGEGATFFAFGAQPRSESGRLFYTILRPAVDCGCALRTCAFALAGLEAGYCADTGRSYARSVSDNACGC